MANGLQKPLALVVEDHPDILEILRFHLSNAGYAVEVSLTGADGLRKAQHLKPSVVILDVMLPEMNGIAVCEALRKSEKTKEIPIIIVTAKGDETDILKGLEMGADDYVTKPFSPKELIARIKAVLRRAEPQPKSSEDILAFGNILMNIQRHTVSVDGSNVKLTLTEFRILEAFLRNSGRVMTREQLIQKATGGDVVIVDRNMDVHISSVRKKLGKSGNYIETIRGIGYRFCQ